MSDPDRLRRKELFAGAWEARAREGKQRYEAAEARVAVLEAALRRYGQHEGGCAVHNTGRVWRFQSGDEVPLPTDCTCGFAALLPPASAGAPEDK